MVEKTVKLRSHAGFYEAFGPTLAVRGVAGSHVSLNFEAYWTNFHVAMSRAELAELRDALDEVLTHTPDETEAASAA